MMEGTQVTQIDFDVLKWDEKGLLPAIVQDAQSKEVLMLAYMNRESLDKTLQTGQTWFWSRSRESLWHKGETSGHIQQVKQIRFDCDADTLLIFVDQVGVACHNGTYTCFENVVPLTPQDTVFDQLTHAASGNRYAILGELESLIAKRDAERPEGAYTTYLFEKGLDKILKKVGEETAEVIIAAKNEDNDELRYESSDLIYHLLVLLRHAKLPLDDVLRELANRHKK